MSGGQETTTTSPTFDPAAQESRDLLGNFLTNAFQSFEQPGSIFGPQQANPLQRQATGGIQQFLGQQAPEQRAFDIAQGPLQGILSGQQNLAGIVNPVFQQNLQTGLAGLSAQAPGRFGSAFLQQGTNLAQRSLNDFNLFAGQLAQQQQQNQIQAALGLGQLGVAAGQGPFSRLLGAGQLGTQQSQFGQQLGLQQQQLLLQLLQGLSQPTGQQQVTEGGGGLGNFLGGILGFGAGALGGPLLGGIGRRIGGGGGG